MTLEEARETAKRFLLMDGDDVALMDGLRSMIVIAREAGHQSDYETLVDAREAFVEQGRALGLERMSGDPGARTISELATPKQLGLVRSLAKQRRVSETAWSFVHFGCAPEELTKRAASVLIDDLASAQRPAGKEIAS